MLERQTQIETQKERGHMLLETKIKGNLCRDPT